MPSSIDPCHGQGALQGKRGGGGKGVSRSEGTGRARGEVRVALTGLRPRMVYNKGGRPFGGGGERLLVAACL